MAKSKKPTTTKASPTSKAKPQSSKATPQKKSQPAPAKKSSPPAKKKAAPVKAKPQVKRSAPKKAVQQSGKKTKQQVKGKKTVAPVKRTTAVAVRGKKTVVPAKGKGKKTVAPTKGKGKAVAPVKGKGKKPVAGKPTGKKRGRKAKNKGSANYQKIKAYIIRRHKTRTGIVGEDGKINDKNATLVAKAIYKHLKAEKKIIDGKITQKIIDEALDFLYGQPKKKLGRLTIPEIPERLQQPNEFYNVEEVNKAMKAGLFRNVWIFSPMILGKRNNAWIYLSPTVDYTYEETFSDWVNWINESIADGSLEGGSPPDVWFKFNEPFRNSRNKRWEVKMISCDNEGNRFVIGYIPNGTSTVPQGDDNEERFAVVAEEEEAPVTGGIATPITPPVTPVTAPPVAPVAPIEPKELTEAKIKTEEATQKSLKLDNLIKIKESIMADMRFNKEMGIPQEADSMKRLTEIRKQIDDLI